MDDIVNYDENKIWPRLIIIVPIIPTLSNIAY